MLLSLSTTIHYSVSTTGMECDAFDNPADFFLDKLNEAENDLKPPDPESKCSRYTYFLNISQLCSW